MKKPVSGPSSKLVMLRPAGQAFRYLISTLLVTYYLHISGHQGTCRNHISWEKAPFREWNHSLLMCSTWARKITSLQYWREAQIRIPGSQYFSSFLVVNPPISLSASTRWGLVIPVLTHPSVLKGQRTLVISGFEFRKRGSLINPLDSGE
jgi:hypothetical protein